jgi:hypothetical protein
VVAKANAAIGVAKAIGADETIEAAKAAKAAKADEAANLEPHWLLELFVAHA